ncbi:hypothetical protein OS188_03830 [Xanthomarina sp. F1114]|uniref:hypothetical protein n=1 Tax=Xanthomarina sp. F1114 TaxID=2996019 RepID=UPI00225E0828|nr:hypothetical protein [Xanthomarina sp. F1114]MCX7547077.1 hypothetical protein [Xanthomarina sp. F1114]
MRNSLVIIAVVALSIIQVNATDKKPIVNTSNKVVTIAKENLIQVFDWTVTTNKNRYSGTSLDLIHANKMVSLVSSGEIVLDKKIESFYMLDYEADNNSNRIYFWEVESSYGTAKGYSSNENDANKMIQLIAKGEIISSKVIISGVMKKYKRKKAQVKK